MSVCSSPCPRASTTRPMRPPDRSAVPRSWMSAPAASLRADRGSRTAASRGTAVPPSNCTPETPVLLEAGRAHDGRQATPDPVHEDRLPLALFQTGDRMRGYKKGQRPPTDDDPDEAVLEAARRQPNGHRRPFLLHAQAGPSPQLTTPQASSPSGPAAFADWSLATMIPSKLVRSLHPPRTWEPAWLG